MRELDAAVAVAADMLPDAFDTIEPTVDFVPEC